MMDIIPRMQFTDLKYTVQYQITNTLHTILDVVSYKFEWANCVYLKFELHSLQRRQFGMGLNTDQGLNLLL